MVSTDDENFDQNPNKKNSRGAAKVVKVSKLLPGEKISVSYNKYGQAIGPGSTQLASYIGVLAKAFVPLTYKDWNKVPKSIKSKMSIAVQGKFDVDPNTQNKVISSMGVSWRQYKHRCTNWIYEAKTDSHNDKVNVPPIYEKYIELPVWEDFVKRRLCEKFEKLRIEQQKRRATFEYNHRLSKKGYAGLGEEMEAENGASYTFDRSVAWAKARVKKTGGYDEKTQKVVDQMDLLRTQSEDGDTAPKQSSDVLTLALGTPEHSGHVRGVGHGVTPTQYFHTPRSGSRKRVKELQPELIEERRKNAVLEAQLDKQKLQEKDVHSFSKGDKHSMSKIPTIASEIKSNGKSSTLPVTSKAPNLKTKAKEKPEREKSVTPSSTGIGVGNKCLLAIGSRSNVVAEGKVFGEVGENGTLHNLPLGKKNCRVSITKAIKPEAALPIPIDGELEFVKDAIGSLVAWPIDLIITGSRETKAKEKPERKKPVTPSSTGIGVENKCLLAIGSRSNVVAEGKVFGEVGKNGTLHNLPLGKKNCRVSITKAIKPEAALPIPIVGELEFVKDAIGSLVAWPNDLIITGSQEKKREWNIDYHDDVDMDNYEEEFVGNPIIGAFRTMIETLESPVIIPMDSMIFGEEVKEWFIPKEDLLGFCKLEPIDATCIATYMRHLYDKFERSRQLFNFFNCGNTSSGQALSRFISKRLRSAKRNQVCYFQCNTRTKFHWTLIVVDLLNNIIYWLDSLQGKPSEEFKLYFNTGLVASHIEGKRTRFPTWITPKCPRQPGDVECGYYVMKFLNELLDESCDSLDTKVKKLAEKETYSMDELDEIRVEFIEFVVKYL